MSGRQAPAHLASGSEPDSMAGVPRTRDLSLPLWLPLGLFPTPYMPYLACLHGTLVQWCTLCVVVGWW